MHMGIGSGGVYLKTVDKLTTCFSTFWSFDDDDDEPHIQEESLNLPI